MVPSDRSRAPVPHKKLVDERIRPRLPGHQIVRIKGLARIVSSRVTSGRPSARAVAPINLSAGSFGYSSGNWVASAATAGLISRTAAPVASRNIRIPASVVPAARKRPFAKKPAISQRVMDATARPPEVLALRMALAARRESRAGSTASQIKTCVSRRISGPAPSRRAERRAPRCRRLSQ